MSNDYTNSQEFEDLRNMWNESKSEYDKQANEYWLDLSEDQKLKAFYSVVKRIHQGDYIDKGSYRWVLYDVFGFGPEAYGLGMDCGYMDIHNAIDNATQFKNDVIKVLNKRQKEHEEWAERDGPSIKLNNIRAKECESILNIINNEQFNDYIR
jgi:hypothetical protein